MLAHQESSVRGENPGDDQRGEVICPADEHHQLIERHDEHDKRNHDRAEVEDEDRVAPREFQAGKGIAADHGCDQLPKHHQNRDQRGVGQRALHVLQLDDFGVILRMPADMSSTGSLRRTF